MQGEHKKKKDDPNQNLNKWILFIELNERYLLVHNLLPFLKMSSELPVLFTDYELLCIGMFGQFINCVPLLWHKRCTRNA